MANGEKVPPADMEMCIGLDSLFDQVMVIGEGRPYLSVLVVLNPLVSEQLSFDPDDAGADQETRLIKRISAHLDSFPGYARVRRVGIVKKPWSIENGLITPTMKTRRQQIMKQYDTLIQSLYEGH